MNAPTSLSRSRKNHPRATLQMKLISIFSEKHRDSLALKISLSDQSEGRNFSSAWNKPVEIEPMRTDDTLNAATRSRPSGTSLLLTTIASAGTGLSPRTEKINRKLF